MCIRDSSSNKELAKIKLTGPGIDSKKLPLPIFPPGWDEIFTQGKSLQLSWFKRILENWKKFTKWFKSKSRIGRWSRNQLARWKKIQRKIKNLIKRIKSIKWKDLLNRVKNNKFIKGLMDWIKSPKKLPKFPKWPKDLLTKTKEAFDKFKQINWKQILEYAGWIKGIGNIILGKATPWGLVATTIINDIVNTGTSKYPDMQGPNAWFNDPSMHVEEIYSQLKRNGHETDVERLEALGMTEERLEKYIKFLKEKAELAEKYGSEYSNLNTKSDIDAQLAELEEKWKMLRKEQGNINDMINPQRRMPMIQDELSEILQKQRYLELKKRDVNNDDNQSSIQTDSNGLSIAQMFSTDSSILPLNYSDSSLSNSAIFNNAPQIYVMESEGETNYVPFSVGASSNNSTGSMMNIDMSAFSSEMLDQFRIVKLSGG